MNVSAVKILAFSFSSVGVGAAISGILSSDNSQESLGPSMATSINAPKSTNDNEITKVKSTCRVYEVRKHPSQYKVEEIKKEIKDKDEFLNGLGSPNSTFVQEIRDACEGRKDRFELEGYTYVFIHNHGGRWMYSKLLQTTDWHKHLTGRPISELSDK